MPGGGGGNTRRIRMAPYGWDNTRSVKIAPSWQWPYKKMGDNVPHV